MSKSVTIEEASVQLGALIDMAGQGEEVFIAGHGHAKVKLVALPAPARTRTFGQYRGKIRLHADFDAPLPSDFWLGGSP
ncbi:MAG: type II toxin-antitoxin system Phd/YefM family antitoxin [Burkholderiales bacterium]